MRIGRRWIGYELHAHRARVSRLHRATKMIGGVQPVRRMHRRFGSFQRLLAAAFRVRFRLHVGLEPVDRSGQAVERRAVLLPRRLPVPQRGAHLGKSGRRFAVPVERLVERRVIADRVALRLRRFHHGPLSAGFFVQTIQADTGLVDLVGQPVKPRPLLANRCFEPLCFRQTAEYPVDLHHPIAERRNLPLPALLRVRVFLCALPVFPRRRLAFVPDTLGFIPQAVRGARRAVGFLERRNQLRSPARRVEFAPNLVDLRRGAIELGQTGLTLRKLDRLGMPFPDADETALGSGALFTQRFEPLPGLLPCALQVGKRRSGDIAVVVIQALLHCVDFVFFPR